MSDFKDRMIEGVEQGWWSEDNAYDSCRDSYLDQSDLDDKRYHQAVDGMLGRKPSEMTDDELKVWHMRRKR